jgi:hypothetical protein
MAPLGGSVLQRSAAAVDESRIGTGLGYFRYTPGNVRYVRSYPASTVLVRRQAMLDLPPVELDDLIAALNDANGLVIYTPESVVVVDPPPLFRPHLRAVHARGRSFGARLRQGRVSLTPLPRSAVLVPILIACIAFGIYDSSWLSVLVALVAVYVALVLLATAAATLRFQSVKVGALASVGIVATHLMYLAGLARGLARR